MLSKARFFLNFTTKNVLERSKISSASLRTSYDRRYYNKDAKKVVESNQKIEPESYSSFVEPYPIDGLNIVHSIEKIDKKGSIFNNYALGVFDKDLLSFPFLLKKRAEFLKLNDQYEMVRGSWNKIAKDHETLKALGYKSLHKLSISEMVYMFEAIGASIQKQFAFGTKENKEIRADKKMYKSLGINFDEKRLQVVENAFESFNSARINIQEIIPLLFHNSFIHYFIRLSENQKLKSWLEENDCKIGLALCEDGLDQTSDVQNWKSTATLSSDKNSWIISGEKCRVIAGDFDKYLICLKSDRFDVVTNVDDKYSADHVLLLVPKEDLTIEDDGEDNLGVKYQKVSFYNLQIDRGSSEVYNESRSIFDFLNVKGCTNLASSAIIVGMMKQLLKNTYADLINNRLGLTNCEIVQYKLYQATSMIYQVESMLYMTAAMYDCFDKDSVLEGESNAVKVLAAEYSYQVFQELRSIFGSRYPFFTTSLDLVSSLDSIFETSLHTRIRIGRESVYNYTLHDAMLDNRNHFLKSSVRSVKNYLKFRRLRNHNDRHMKEMTKYVHHQLYDACLWAESCLNRLSYSTNFLVNHFKDSLVDRHNDLNRVAEISIDIFKMISVLSRGSHSFCYGFPNNDAERDLCLAICKETFLKNLQLFEDLNREALTDNDDFAKSVFKANLDTNGYFASLFRDNN